MSILGGWSSEDVPGLDPDEVPPEVRVLFAARMAGRAPDQCWLWTSNPHRYGSVSWLDRREQERRERAHRVAFVLEHGVIRPRLFIRHRCDTPGCCNPRHLEAGSAKDNYWDMVRRGRRVLRS